MLMQIAAWLIGISVFALALAYALIFTSLLAAKFRQSHAGFRQHAMYATNRNVRATGPRAADSR